MIHKHIFRYMQIARCYRDETTRPDRQPEFTQLDLEMSFVCSEDIINLTEEMLQYSWPYKLETPFPRYDFNEIMLHYGTDKPDFRIPFKVGISHYDKYRASSVSNHLFFINFIDRGHYRNFGKK